MKKLMIAAVAVAFAAIAQAGTCYWSASATFSDIDGNEFSEENNITAYLFDTATLTQAALVESWVAKSTATGSAAVESTWYDAYQLDVTSEIGSSGTHELYWAVVKGDDLFVSSAISQEIADVGDTEYIFDDESDNIIEGAKTYSAAGWYKAAPEPTSGLMLLLGMGVLALRRRRA